MTVPNEIVDAKKVVEYVRDLRYVSKVALVGHSQGGVVAAMTAGELAEAGESVAAVALMAPAAVLRDDAIRGSTFGKQYNPLDPPEYVELLGPGSAWDANISRRPSRCPYMRRRQSIRDLPLLFMAMPTVWCLTPTGCASTSNGRARSLSCRNTSTTGSRRTFIVLPTSSRSICSGC